MLKDLGKKAKRASYDLVDLDTNDKNQILKSIQIQLEKDKDKILQENKKDMDNGKKNNLSEAFLDRLLLTPERIDDMISSLDVIINLEDQIGKIQEMKINEYGLLIGKQKTPLGVLGIIYESRPNVTLDAASLALKSSNAIILRGGEEAINSNRAIASSIRKAIEILDFNPDFIQLIEDTSRESSMALMRLNEYVDVLIPRGGQGLIQSVVENATVPVIETGEGNSSVYIDEFADIDMAINIIENSKCQRTGVCNAMESLYIHKNLPEIFFQKLNYLIDKHNITVHAEKSLMDKIPSSIEADEEDYYTEYLAMEFSVKTVNSLDEAIKETMKYGSGHSDVIVTDNYNNAMTYQRKVNSACVYINASSRFTDGGQFGLGAELGISTQKLHARGPVALEELTSYKYIIQGNGQIRK